MSAMVASRSCMAPGRINSAIVQEGVPARLVDLEERVLELVRDIGRLVNSLPDGDD